MKLPVEVTSRAQDLVLYRCDKCGGFTVTVQRDPGTLPEAIGCRARSFADCTGRASFYLGAWPAEVPKTPAWEWYDPHPISGPSTENRAVEWAARVLVIRSLRFSGGKTS